MSSVEHPCLELGQVMLQAWPAGSVWLQDIYIRGLLKHRHLTNFAEFASKR